MCIKSKEEQLNNTLINSNFMCVSKSKRGMQFKMKKNRRLKKLVIILVVLLINFIQSSLFYKVSAENEVNSIVQETLKSQSDSIGISGFIEEANKYKSEDFDIDVNELVSSAIKGKVDNKTIGKKISAILFSQVKEAITAIR